MQEPELMPIGEFARRSGLTPSALRFYADSGLLRPAEVDPDTGYRRYGTDQVARATVLRGLREVGMPLRTVADVLDATPGEAARLIDEHVAGVLDDALGAQRTAAALTASLDDGPVTPVATLKGPVLAAAVEQVLTATAAGRDVPVLRGLHVEVTPASLTFTATDRYRLSTRTLVPAEPPGTTWTATVDGDDLRVAVADVRRSPTVRIDVAPRGLRLLAADRTTRYCGVLPDPFPDHRHVLEALPDVVTRVTVPRNRLLRALEEHVGEQVTLDVTGHRIDVGGARLDCAVTGPDLRIRFALTTLYPAVDTAVGPDVLLDLRGPDQPVTVRSADRGDLTTLAMPVAARPDPTEDR